MLETEHRDITVRRGDTAGFTITPLNSDKTPYFLKDGEYVRFFVRMFADSEPLIEKTLTFQDDKGALYVSLSGSDTTLSCSRYIYEAKLYNADGSEVYTFIGGGSDKPNFVVT